MMQATQPKHSQQGRSAMVFLCHQDIAIWECFGGDLHCWAFYWDQAAFSSSSYNFWLVYLAMFSTYVSCILGLLHQTEWRTCIQFCSSDMSLQLWHAPLFVQSCEREQISPIQDALSASVCGMFWCDAMHNLSTRTLEFAWCSGLPIYWAFKYKRKTCAVRTCCIQLSEQDLVRMCFQIQSKIHSQHNLWIML